MPNWVLFLATLATRLPFIWVGYGVHTDGWRVVRTIARLLSGEYATSRPPGYPLPEAILAAVTLALGETPGMTSPAVVNLVSAVYSAVAAVAFRSCLHHARVPHAAWLALLTFCFPVLLIESTSAKEYLCALMFLLLSFRSLIGGRVALGGVLLGLAAASRPTALLFGASALAWLAVVHAPGWGLALRRALTYGAAACATVTLAFLPLFLKYGPRLLEVVHTQPALVRVVYAATLGTFGLVGSFAIAVLTGLALWSLARRLRAVKQSADDGDRRQLAHLAAAGVNVVVFAAAYLAMPNEGAYLIPAIPSLVTLIALAVPPRAALAGCALVASSSLLLSAYQREGEVIVDVAGSAVADQVERRRIDCIARAAGAFAAALGENEYLIAAHRMPMVRHFTPGAQRLHVIDQIDAREGDRFRLGLDSNGVITPASERRNGLPADARFFVLDEMAVYQRPVEGLAPRPVVIAGRCPVPRTALLRVPLDLRRRAQ